ncbi:MAG: dienelactone hydrolase family protein [Alteraurantiacibacter sp.]|nr:dienelactone hydrolase family protein [Alteraurantiacibacter sp.]
MCDQEMARAMPRSNWRVNRRDFARLGAAAGAGIVAAGSAGAALAQSQLAEKIVVFDAPGGRLDGMFIYPRSGRHPAVVLWPDIAGLRDAKLMMGRELAREGYAVLVANPYYRSVEGQQFDDFDDWRNSGGFQRVGPWMEKNTPAAIVETMGAVVEWLDRQPEVDSSRGIGVQGYCMTGSWAIRAAAALPDRVKAAASFHGGGLVGDAPDSPVNLLASIAPDARVLIAIARNDDAQAPGDKDALRAAAEAAGRNVEIEVYRADHGWTVPDSPVYDVDEADRAFARLLAMYQAAL